MENQTSFDLNAAIQDWRAQLSKSPSFHAEDLDELESHLRDSEASLRAQGLTAEEAFLIAVRRTGAADVLAAEFATVNRSSLWQGRLLWMTAGWIVLPPVVGLTAMLLGGLTTFAWFPTAARFVLPFPAIIWLQSNLARKSLKTTLRLASVLLLVSGFSGFLKVSTDHRALGVTAPFVMSIVMLALFAFLRLKRRHA